MSDIKMSHEDLVIFVLSQTALLRAKTDVLEGLLFEVCQRTSPDDFEKIREFYLAHLEKRKYFHLNSFPPVDRAITDRLYKDLGLKP